MRLSLERHLPVPPAAVWPFVTDPDRMNLWSTARVTAVAPGDGGRPDGIGALRSIRIALPGVAIEFEEVIEDAAPPARLVYRIVDGLPVRSHRGVVTIEPANGGGASRLRWQVEAEFPAPGLGTLAGMLLGRELARSLDALGRAVREAAATPGVRETGAREVEDPAELPALYAAAEASAAHQRSIADELSSAGDPRRWFPRVYQFVSELQIAACREGRFLHPGWVLRLVPAFHAYYVVNLERARGRAPGVVESHWRSAFRAMDEGERWFARDPLRAHLYGVAKGMQAHIEEDLPRALAEVHIRHYAGRCDHARFRADYLRMGTIFRDAGDRLTELIPRGLWPIRTRILRAVLPAELQDRMMSSSYYDLPRQRRKAFERGGRIAEMLMGKGIGGGA